MNLLKVLVVLNFIAIVTIVIVVVACVNKDWGIAGIALLVGVTTLAVMVKTVFQDVNNAHN